VDTVAHCRLGVCLCRIGVCLVIVLGVFLAGLHQLAVALGQHDLPVGVQLALWCNMAYGTMQWLGVAVFHELAYHALGLLELERCASQDVPGLNRLRTTLDLAIALGGCGKMPGRDECTWQTPHSSSENGQRQERRYHNRLSCGPFQALADPAPSCSSPS